MVDAQARACAVAGAGLRATPMLSRWDSTFETKIGGFARLTCRKFGGDLPDIAETFFAFAVKAWAFEPPPNDVIWSLQQSKRGALAARQRRAAVGAYARHLRERSRFPLSLSPFRPPPSWTTDK